MVDIVELTPELIAELREKRMVRAVTEEIELPNFGPGEEGIGPLTAEEQLIFAEVCTIDAELEDWLREISARQMDLTSKELRSERTFEEIMDSLRKSMVFKDDTEAEVYYEAITRREYLHALFWWNVRKRLHAYGAMLGIRAGWKVARSGHKYKVTES